MKSTRVGSEPNSQRKNIAKIYQEQLYDSVFIYLIKSYRNNLLPRLSLVYHLSEPFLFLCIRFSSRHQSLVQGCEFVLVTNSSDFEWDSKCGCIYIYYLKYIFMYTFSSTKSADTLTRWAKLG